MGTPGNSCYSYVFLLVIAAVLDPAQLHPEEQR